MIPEVKSTRRVEEEVSSAVTIGCLKLKIYAVYDFGAKTRTPLGHENHMQKLIANDPETRSADIVAENIEHLKALFPEASTEGKIDFEVLKLLLGGEVDERDQRDAVQMKHMQLETSFLVKSNSPFYVKTYYVDFSRRLFREDLMSIIKFSERQYAIPHSSRLKIATPSHYREIEEELSSGIGDLMEATYKRKTNMETFQKENNQKPMWGSEHVSLTLTYIAECWMFCASIEPKLKTSREIEKIRKSLDVNYDCCTSITDPSAFAKQLGIDFGNSFKPNILNHPGPALWRSYPVVYVKHGPVIYTDQVSKEIECFPQEIRSSVTPFIKRSKFSNQKEYRIVISLLGNARPKEQTLLLDITDELRRLTRTVE